MDVDAVRAVTRLIDKGFEAYLVGGCVRDLLLDRTPKDYDIATEARPPQVKRTFPRNCRIIGRRFKLAHLHFHGNTKILECSTFRRTPQEKPEGANGEEEDLLITRDNEFGTAEEDALRRDFTINALFLDPTRDLIVDHVNGLEDIDARVIRTIGDPVVRFREDPVRILRAVKFAGRLGFEIEKKTFEAMAETAEDLRRAAPPRVLEEILRLLRSGHAHDSFELLRDVGAIDYLVPVVGRFLHDATDEQHDSFWALLDALDRHVQAQPDGSEPPPNGVLLAVLMFGAVEAERDHHPTRSASSLAEKLLGSLAVDLRLPRRDSGCLKRICGVQHRFVQPESKRRFRVESFVHSPYFDEALQLFELRTAANRGDEAAVQQWHDLRGGSISSDDRTDEDEPAESERSEEMAPRKKRRRRRRRRADDELEAGSPDDATSEDRSEHDAAPEEQAQAAGASQVEDAPADESRTDAVATGDETPGDESEEPAAAPKTKKKAARKKRATRKKRIAEASSDDLSDVTFPMSEEPSPHGDPLAGHDAKEWTRDKPEAGSFPKYDDGSDPYEDPEHEDPEHENSGHENSRHEGSERGDSEHGDSEHRDVDRPPRQAVEPERDEESERPTRRKRSRRRRPAPDRGRDDGDDHASADHPAEELVVGDTSDGDTSDGDTSDGDAPDGDAPDGNEARGPEADGDDDRPARKRRRRSRGGRGRSRSDREAEQGDGVEAEARGDSGDDHSSDDHSGDRGEPRARKVRGKKGNSRRRSEGKGGGESRRGGESKRGGEPRRGKGKKKPSRRSGGNRDVDVVPRYRDRRGKVEVIEPVSLDLSAFDVELDPKRVPTFGSIVEGKGRPKRRGPRMPDKGSDEYKPPPPPGGDGGPDAAPPPPPADDPDTFGDW